MKKFIPKLNIFEILAIPFGLWYVALIFSAVSCNNESATPTDSSNKEYNLRITSPSDGDVYYTNSYSSDGNCIEFEGKLEYGGDKVRKVRMCGTFKISKN